MFFCWKGSVHTTPTLDDLPYCLSRHRILNPDTASSSTSFLRHIVITLCLCSHHPFLVNKPNYNLSCRFPSQISFLIFDYRHYAMLPRSLMRSNVCKFSLGKKARMSDFRDVEVQAESRKVCISASRDKGRYS